MKIPTGIRAEMEEGWVLKLYPRSGLGFKFRLQLNNTVGIIDSDYFYSDNEGPYLREADQRFQGRKSSRIEKGTGFMQGIFVEYGITVDDDAVEIRNGGFGSTHRPEIKENQRLFGESSRTAFFNSASRSETRSPDEAFK